MKLDEMKSAYDAYNEELETRKKLINAILTNNKNDYINFQERYINLYEKSNAELYPLLDKLSEVEITDYLNQSMVNPQYKDLVDFFLILHGYTKLKNSNSTQLSGNNAQKFNEDKNTIYYDLVKWYMANHGVGSKNKEEIIKEFVDTTVESISIRNILAGKEELNSVFDNIEFKSDLEREIAVEAFVTEIDLFLVFIDMYLLKSTLLGTKEIPKSLILRLVLMNILTKKYQLGFRIEEYVTRYYENHNIAEKLLGDNPLFNMKLFNELVEECIIEINDITNDYNNYKEKGKAY